MSISPFTPNDWVENFRMSRTTFTYLCNELWQTIQKQDTIMRKAISVEQRIALTLWRLATMTDYRTIGHLFGVSKTAVCFIVKEVCSAIVELLLPRYIKVPTLYQKGMNGSLFPEWKKTIAQEEIPLVVLGDPAYPLLPWVMKPYVDNAWTPFT